MSVRHEVLPEFFLKRTKLCNSVHCLKTVNNRKLQQCAFLKLFAVQILALGGKD